jgi:UDP-N-acetylglucosamine--N-acetylmuramyl-(pentapeptide) pyrophosphoryl-undecaprenol N-acetylglucosamine transferase
VHIVIAGGGTGGHLFPGIAIAEEFIKHDSQNKVLFIGTKRGIESKLLGKLGYELRTINVEGVKGRGIKALIKGFYQIPKSMWQSRRILKQFRPQIVIGVGGYASGPAVLAAHFMGLPTAIAEQNAIPGITNKILGKFADKVFVTYSQSQNWFSSVKVIVSGNPVRAAFTYVREKKKEKNEFWNLLIFGGSQGAAAINKAVIAMMPQMQRIKNKLRVLHQAGGQEMQLVRKAYEKYGVQAEVTPFIVDMVSAYAQADLIICRAGATSLAEITAAGKAAILIPFPYAANDHQTKNAQVLVDEGAAIMINERDMIGERLFAAMESLLTDEEKLREMGANSAKQGNINAAAAIVETCIKLMAVKN